MIKPNILNRSILGSLFSLLVVSAFAQIPPAGPHALQQAQYGNIAIPAGLGQSQNPPRDLVEGIREPSHAVFGYHPYWNGTDYQNYQYDFISHLAWFGLEMNSNGDITNAHGWPWTDLVDVAHAEGVKVIVTVTLFDNTAIGQLLASATARQNAIDNLIARVNAGNADGVNIDFEFVPSGSQANFNTFIHDLSETFHDQIPNSEVSIAMPSVDWWGSYDYAYLAENSDGLMIMAYGYYYGGSANAGPISPLNSGLSSWYIRRTIEDYLDDTGGDGSKLMLGLPWYGRSWQVTSSAMGAPTVPGTSSSITYSNAEPSALSNGKNYNLMAPAAWYNYNNGNLRQAWYDDSTSLGVKYAYAKEVDLMGIGIWALGYDGGRSEIWGGLSDAFGATAPPLTPHWFTTRYSGEGNIQITIGSTSFADEYELFAGTDPTQLVSWQVSSTPTFEASGFETDTVYYMQVRASNSFGNSNNSELLAAVTAADGPRVLIVQGFERTSGTVNNLDYVKRHGPAIWSAGFGFDGASNDAVANGAIDLTDYAIVDWISGEEATATVSFDSFEQTRIADFLEAGGRILVSGSEIGWDLEASGSAADIEFYRNYFKADYVADDVGVYSFYGLGSGAFSGLSDITFDNGSQGSYDVDYPDGIKPFGGSVSCLRYDNVDYNTQGGAGIQYFGPFGESTLNGGVIYLAVGFETLYPETNRNQVMSAALNYLSQAVSTEPEPRFPEQFTVAELYPNPFNGQLSIPVFMYGAGDIQMEIWDLRGRQLVSLNKHLTPGSNMLSWNPETHAGLESGLYIITIRNNHQSVTRRVTYLK